MLVKGLDLCKLTAESTHLPVDKYDINIDESLLKKEIYFFPPPQDSWYSDIKNFGNKECYK